MRRLLRRWVRRTGKGVLVLLLVIGGTHLVLLLTKGFSEDGFNYLFSSLAISLEGVSSGKVYQVCTSIFIHDPKNIFHVLITLVVLYSLGPPLERYIGTKYFLILYVASGIIGGLVQMLVAMIIGKWDEPMLVASGPLMGLLLAFSILFSNVTVRIWGLAPLSAKHLIWIAIALDVIGLIIDQKISWPAHLGGIGGAYLFITYLRRKRFIY